MAKAKKGSRTDFDSPWKEILEHFFPQFMQFFFPNAYEQIDWSKGYRFLDQELQQIAPESEIGPRRVDKLVEVYRHDGQDAWVLAHVEIQGQKDLAYEKRLYVYNYRLFDRYDRPVATLSVLTDSDPAWRPHRYGYELFDCHISLDFPVVKLLDYKDKQAELEKSDNPFAIVVMAHLETQKTRRKPAQRYEAKLKLAKMMYRKGYQRVEIINLFRFIDWIMTLPEDMDWQFLLEIARFEETEKMPYVTSVERIGMEKGMALGRQEGQQEGLQEGLRVSIVQTLELRFGRVSPRIELFLQQVQDVDDLRELHKQAVLVPSLTVFEQGLPG